MAKLHVGAAGGERGDGGSQGLQGPGAVLLEGDGVGVAHVDREEAVLPSAHGRHEIRAATGHAHVDQHLDAVSLVSTSADLAAPRSGVGLHDQGSGLASQEVPGHAAQPVAAHLGAAPVGVADDHPRGGPALRLHQEHAVRPHAEPAVAEPPHRGVVEGGAEVAEHHEVVPEALPLLEADPHRAAPPSRARASSSFIPLTSMTLPRLLAPTTMRTSLRRTSSARARSLHSSVLAAPSAGGAVSATSSAPSRTPRMADREERGRTWTEKRTPPARSVRASDAHGPVFSGASLVVMPVLAKLKLRAAEKISSRALRADAVETARRILRRFRLEGHCSKRPAELSGGQRQRVAIGRALARQAGVFLFDEPLSNLDAALRVQMRGELLRLHQFHRLQYEAAGSLVRLDLPADSPGSYARELVA